MKIQDILLLKNVNRWNIVNVSREQSVAEHTFNVTMIARAICAEYGIPDDKVTKYALDHDLDEVMYGDIPSPAKKRLGIKNDYSGKSKIWCTDLEVFVVKIADVMEAVHYIQENGVGRHAKVVLEWNSKELNGRFKSIFQNKKLYDSCIKIWHEISVGEFESEKR